MNQCDGCRRGLPLMPGTTTHKGPAGYDYIGCTKDRYDTAEHRIVADTAGWGALAHRRLTCVPCGKTLVRQPFMNDTRWERDSKHFLAAHPGKVETR